MEPPLIEEGSKEIRPHRVEARGVVEIAEMAGAGDAAGLALRRGRGDEVGHAAAPGGIVAADDREHRHRQHGDATSITSGGDGEDRRPQTVEIQKVNPQLKFHNSLRGYLMCDVDGERWQTDYIVMDQVSDRKGVGRSRQKLAVEAGAARLQMG
ncbi:hypothetical protein OKW76_07800 [Sphingomonas sp. S1-29]|uniref:hypothetical protein n=1 Tax=Sphingomonas sp. S1-29 TaxID=2991074 RepID=UPI00223FB937|nr:hypothetical protein [Sphingomonas sp. S1-29]UZK70911.1 hypothetical protein OKW76_07800 [Sphingomonas sp. S1-29]